MDYENLTPQYRIEEYLEAIVEGWAEATQYPYPDYPSWRIEEFLDAFITYIWEDGDHPRHPCPEPAWRLEECLRAIYDVMTGAATPCPFPLPTTNRIEEYLAAIHAYLADGTELPVPEPVWRIEQWLAYVLDGVKQGGGVETTVSGSPAHITNALAKAALSVLASIEPIQDLHGYDHPWPAGGGKNKFITTLQTTSAYGTTFTVNADGSITVSGTPTQLARVSMRSGSFVDTSSICIFSTGVSMPIGTRVFCARNHEGAVTYPTISNTHNFAVGDTYSNMLLEISTNYDGEPFTLYPMIEDGSTATAWSPYSNICPISGRTGVSVYRTGKNLLDASNCVDNIYPDGGAMKFSSVGGASVFYASVKPNTTYTMSANNGDRTIICSCDTTPASGVAIKRIIFSSSSLLIPQTFTTAADETLVALYVNRYASTKPTEIQLELGSTATTYEPYNGNTYAVDWTSQAGTVYGGTLDVVTGELVVTYKKIALGDYNYGKSSDNNFYISTVTDIKAYGTGTTRYGLALCDSFAFLTGNWASHNSTCTCYYNAGYNGYRIFFHSEEHANDSIAQFKAYMQSIGASFVYELATPITYQLTPQEVQMLLGENYVWSSSGDTVSVTYYAEGNANPLQSLNILLGGRYSNPKTADDVSDREALEIILGGNK